PYLTSLDGASDRLELVEADLLQSGSYKQAVKGCEYVLHTASPYIINVKNPQLDLVEPALRGTLEVMEACLFAGSVKRVVLTSSIAAVTDQPDSSVIYTEKEWNTLSSLTRNPYHYSKTLAERAAWEFIKEKKTDFDLVVINPALVTGPSLVPSLNTSNQMIRDIMTGVFPMIMDVNWGFVDVRDTARAHILAMETPAAQGRYLCSAETMNLGEMIQFLQMEGYGNYKLPVINLSGKAGTLLMKLLSYSQPKDTGTFIRTHVGRLLQIDNSKIRKDLGMTFMPIKKSILEAIRDMIARGHLSIPEK
ncbi:MAG: NAD-dependent epimerase/dehydratase family protein, partial [Chlorobiaceae bacterium]|nr:NAD-dependent epimerase/dehydratase family protein [Chlorobiaceae bacterium]